MKRDVSQSKVQVPKQDDFSVFLALERLFRSKGHSANKATELAYEAMDVLNSWYEEEVECAE